MKGWPKPERSGPLAGIPLPPFMREMHAALRAINVELESRGEETNLDALRRALGFTEETAPERIVATAVQALAQVLARAVGLPEDEETLNLLAIGCGQGLIVGAEMIKQQQFAALVMGEEPQH